MRIAVLGVGSIGGVLLGALSDTNCELVAISRGNSADKLSSLGLVLHSPEGPIEAIPPESSLLSIASQDQSRILSQTVAMQPSYAASLIRPQYSPR